MTEPVANSPSHPSLFELFKIFLRLGCTSFGGPVAHLAYFRSEFVQRRKWFSDESYADLVALCQFLPGPASSQVGIAIGLSRHGYGGALVSWLGFTLPSALLLIFFALSLSHSEWLNAGALQGLKIVAVAVVMQACWGMGKQLCPDRQRQILMLLSACLAVLFPGIGGQLAVIVLGGVIGYLFLSASSKRDLPSQTPMKTKGHSAWLVAFALLLFLLPWLASFSDGWLEIFNSYYRSGALVFGGGHVVLPLLQAEVSPHWVDSATFMAGYGAAQAVPGPLFTFAAFLGAASSHEISGVAGGLFALLAIFLPSFLLIFGALPLWQKLVTYPVMRAAACGINAAVVGLLLAALYDPVWTSAIFTAKDFAWLLATMLALHSMKLPPWLAVILSGSLGAWLL